MRKNWIQTGLRLNETEAKKLTIIAKGEKRSLNNLICFIVSQYISKYEEEHGAIAIEE